MTASGGSCRDREGLNVYARISTILNSGSAEERSRRVAVARELFPDVTAQGGCRGGMVLDNPSAHELKVVVFWESAVAMFQACNAGAAFRERFAAATGIPVGDIDVQLCEVDTFDVSGLSPMPRLVEPSVTSAS